MPVMEFRRTCMEDKSVVMDDGARTVILNAGGDTSGLPDGLKELIEYIHTGKTGTGSLVRERDERVQNARQNRKWGLEYMTLKDRIEEMMETDLAEARAEAGAEGISLGKEEAKTETARNLLKEGISVSVIAKTTGLSLKETGAL